jgi:sec-independent protein translocase protein TatA
MLNIGPQELLLILVVALLVVGPARLPELGRTIGKGLRELRKAQDEVRRTIQVSLDEPSTPARGKPARAPGAVTRAATATDADTSTNGPDPDAARGSTAAAAVSEAVAAAHETSPPEEDADETPAATEVARTLGRSLAELRRAREEIQRTFRVDVDGRSMSGGAAPAPRTAPTAPSADTPRPSTAPEAASDGATGSPDETPVT